MMGAWIHQVRFVTMIISVFITGPIVIIIPITISIIIIVLLCGSVWNVAVVCSIFGIIHTARLGFPRGDI